MSDLVDFLLARVAEDEAVAKVEIAEEKQVGGARHGEWSAVSRGEMQFAGGAVAAVPDPMLTHIARHDPARILAECEAKRRIVALHKLITEDYAGQWWTDPAPPGTYVRTGCSNCISCGVDGEEYVVEGPCPTLRALALPYADHPDYRPEWRL